MSAVKIVCPLNGSAGRLGFSDFHTRNLANFLTALPFLADQEWKDWWSQMRVMRGASGRSWFAWWLANLPTLNSSDLAVMRAKWELWSHWPISPTVIFLALLKGCDDFEHYKWKRITGTFLAPQFRLTMFDKPVANATRSPHLRRCIRTASFGQWSRTDRDEIDATSSGPQMLMTWAP